MGVSFCFVFSLPSVPSSIPGGPTIQPQQTSYRSLVWGFLYALCSAWEARSPRSPLCFLCLREDVICPQPLSSAHVQASLTPFLPLHHTSEKTCHVSLSLTPCKETAVHGFARDQDLDSKDRVLKWSLNQDFRNVIKRIAETSPCSILKMTVYKGGDGMRVCTDSEEGKAAFSSPGSSHARTLPASRHDSPLHRIISYQY